MSDDPIIALLNGINDRLGRMEKGLASLEARMTVLDQGQTTLRVDLMARMERLDDQVTLIREDITVNIGAADSVRTANEVTKAELGALSSMVFTMTRQVRRLQTQVDELSGKPSAP